MKDKGISYGLILAILLTVAFVVLRLLKVISWSWWWVVSPLWIYFAISVIMLIVVAVIVAIRNGKR